MIVVKKGDIFSDLGNLKTPVVIGHVVNDAGFWGKGFTAPLSEKFPWAERTYRRWAERGLMLGKTLTVPIGKRLFVSHMCAQHNVFERNRNPIPFRLNHFSTCARATADFCDAIGASLRLPKVGAGLGRGNWEEIIMVIEKEFETLNVTIFELPS
jgi:hypothetical protein